MLVDAEYEVVRAAVIPLAVVQAQATRITYNNGYRVHLASGILGLPEVRDVTELFREAADA